MKIAIDPLSESSWNAAIAQLEKYEKKIRQLETELPKALAELGETEAQVRFNSACYDILISGIWDTPNISVTAEPTEKGFAVVASGHEVCFVEFGAGVYYNGAGSYLGTRPPGVVGIGEYGSGLGKRWAWAFTDAVTGEKKITRGTPANDCMYFTAAEMRRRIADTARRILKND